MRIDALTRKWWRTVGRPVDLEGAESWLSAAQEQKGSWWTDWAAWIKAHGAGEKAAPKNPGNARYKPIEAAPGRYVKERAV